MRVAMVLDTVWGALDIRADSADISDDGEYPLIEFNGDDFDAADGVMGIIEEAARMADRTGNPMEVDFKLQGRLVARIEVTGVE